jgi:hypothetical protein
VVGGKADGVDEIKESEGPQVEKHVLSESEGSKRNLPQVRYLREIRSAELPSITFGKMLHSEFKKIIILKKNYSIEFSA